MPTVASSGPQAAREAAAMALQKKVMVVADRSIQNLFWGGVVPVGV